MNKNNEIVPEISTDKQKKIPQLKASKGTRFGTKEQEGGGAGTRAGALLRLYTPSKGYREIAFCVGRCIQVVKPDRKGSGGSGC
ncbi:unnamed protein product [Prunus brigantina]